MDSGFEELISAYLDGELVADERLLVEKQLAESAQFRQLFEDLKRQRESLRALPRYQPPADFAARIVAHLEAARLEAAPVETGQLESSPTESTVPAPVAALTSAALTSAALTAGSTASDSDQSVPVGSVSSVRVESYARPAEQTNASEKNDRRNIFGWKTMTGVAIALAASLLIVLLPNLTDNGPGPGGPGPGGPGPGGLVTTVQPRTKLTYDDLVAVQKEFKSRYPYLMIYDYAISPKGQQNRVFEKWIEAVGLHVDKPLMIEERLEKGLLASEFFGTDKVVGRSGTKDEAKDNIEMLFIRSTLGKIDDLGRLGTKAGVNDEVRLRMGMTFTTPKEAEIFIQLNEAASPYEGNLSAFIDSWSKPGVYPLQFRLGLQSASFSRFAAISGPIAESDKSVGLLTMDDLPVIPETQLSELGTKRSDPSQLLVILRKFKDPFPVVAKPQPIEAR